MDSTSSALNDHIVSSDHDESSWESQSHPLESHRISINDHVDPPDEDTCRICRGEASEEEPLYHPCKCSGSIKYVHQDCLLEWLKHSKKSAVCELCNTPYKFTKLYADDMPSMVPLTLLIKTMFGDSIRVIAYGLRITLVMALWLLVLPLFSSLMVRTYTITAESVPGDFKALLYPMSLVKSSLSGSISSPLIVLPTILQETWPSQLQIVVTLILEGELLIIFLIFCAFVVMIVREWILQNDAFVRDLQQIGNVGINRNDDNAWVDQPGDVEAAHVARAARAAILARVNNEIVRDRRENDNENGEHVLGGIDLNRLQFGQRGENDIDNNDDENNVNPLRNRGPLFRVDRNGNNDMIDNDNPLDAANVNDIINPVPRPADPFVLPNRRPQLEDFFQEPVNVPEDDLPIGEVDGFLDIIGLKGPIVNAFATCAAATVLSGIALACFYLLPYATGRLAAILVGETITPLLAVTKISIGYLFSLSLDYLATISLLIDEKLLHRGPSPWTSQSPKASAQLQELHDRLSYQWKEFVSIDFNFPVPDDLGIGTRLTLTLVGYVLTGSFIAVFISRSNIARSRTGRDLLRTLKEVGAIFKVIAVIGIELVLFPIFCGLLLDFSLLPLFESASVADQIAFALRFPITSTVLHWALGTCYMFIFAMFVSLCRRIMRPGVLYFVRDPNDPNFHPIKDVLDRGLMSQLAKIGLSAIIYGALIVLCLGGVIYTLRYLNVEFLPISFASTTREHILIMIPISAAYCLTLPVIIHCVRSLSIMYTIWNYAFESSCSYLRLSSFILNKPVPQEQGSIRYGSIVAWFMSTKPDYSHPATVNDIANHGKWDMVYFVKDGGFVRAPDTDSISSRKKLNLFIPVTKDDERLDGIEEGSESNELEKYHIVYRPPMFRIRIALLLCCIWGYGALVILTMILAPVYTGHLMSQFLLPSIFKDMCDVFQFIIGSTPFFAVFYVADNWARVKDWIRDEFNYIRQSPLARSEVVSAVAHLSKILFLIAMFIFLPTAVGGIIDLYISSPLYHLISSEIVYSKSLSTKFMSGLLTLLLVKNIILQRVPNSSIARSYRAMIQDGWLRYNHTIAINELLVPLITGMAIAAFAPLIVAWCVVKLWYHQSPLEQQSRVYIAIYPVAASWVLIDIGIYSLRSAIKLWITRARDEVYLIGRQLENLEH